MIYGVLPNGEGFRRMPLDIIMQRIAEFQLANISPTLDVSAGSPQHGINLSFARQIDELWTIAEQVYEIDPDVAAAFQLQIVSKLTGTARRGASHSTVSATVELDSGTTLLAGTHFANVTGQPENRWTPLANFTAPSTGSHQVVFRAEETGPIQAAAGTLEVINTSVTGWDSITNALAATVGRNIDDDDELRARREADVAQTGSATAQAIRADVNDVENVESVTVFENKGDVIDANGLPPHSVEVIVDDGDPAAATDNEIAQAIFDATGAGIRWFSTTGDSGVAADDQGVENTVPFSRVAFVPIHLAYEIEVTDEYTSDTEFKSFIVAEANK